MEINIRPVNDEQITDFLQVMGYAFGFDTSPDTVPRFTKYFEPDRSRCAWDGDQLVGTLSALSFDLNIPGSTLPAAGTTLVSVLPTHCRRGLLRRMMLSHLEEVREKQEAIAALWASEAPIYGRFGFGPAAYVNRIKIQKEHTAFITPPSSDYSIRLIDIKTAPEILPELFNKARANRPGTFSRSPAWWANRILADVEKTRGGYSALRCVLVEEAKSIKGYALYRVKNEWLPEFINNEIKVIELFATEPEEEKVLWNFLFNTDLTTTITAPNRPSDCLLRWWLKDPRRLETVTSDSLWIRLVDASKGLSNRKYNTSGELVISIKDDICPWNQGIFKLSADETGKGECLPSTQLPEITLDIRELGALYMGDNSAKSMAQAGLIQGSDKAIKKTDLLFSWPIAPWCPEIF